VIDNGRELKNPPGSEISSDSYSTKNYFLRDLVPEHFHLALERRRGELGFLAASGCFFICPALRAQ